APPESWHWLRYCGHRVVVADIRRVAGTARKNLYQLDSQSASDANSCDRKRLGGKRALFWRRSQHGALRSSATRYFFHRCRRITALEPGVQPDGGFVCDGFVYWVDVANGRRSQFVYRDFRANSRFWRRAQYGQRSAWTAPRYTCLVGNES